MTCPSDILPVTLALVLWCVAHVHSSLCVVSRWSEWSECMGSCQFAQQVRNRDVLRPPFPEPHLNTSKPYVRSCPQLYEIKKCIPTECLSEEYVDVRTKTQQSPYDAPVINEFFRDLPIVQPVTFDSVRSPFETDKAAELNQKILKKVTQGLVERQRLPSPSRRTLQAHRPNCTRDLNPRCCRLVREVCPDNSEPKKLIRWFRLPDEQLCRPFHYPHCDANLEKRESPLSSESACLQMCFSDYEKAVLPSLRII